MKFNLDEKALEKMVQPAMRDTARKYDRGSENIHAWYTGKPERCAAGE